jgi:putative oxygen-independent coproporphyrinogen III oxidase
MAGMYLHIPFCKQACHYCNFHFSTTRHLQADLVRAMIRELEMQQYFLHGAALQTIYFGGGTPSLLETAELVSIFEAIGKWYPLNADMEITLEANPDDLNAQKLHDLKTYTPVNRLSIGIQSFREADLRWMHRAHSGVEARQCIDNAQAAGFHNLTIDLIYGVPGADDAVWKNNLQTALEMGIPHLSCYCLTVEDGTALGKWVARGKQAPPDDERASAQFEILMDFAEANGYEQYEISNFARPGHRAVHNSNYWLGVPYLGIGPSAHAYDGQRRQWNIANNPLYIKSIEAGTLPAESEWIGPVQAYNEYVMTALRTSWGCSAARISAFGPAFLDEFTNGIRPFLEKGWVQPLFGDTWILTRTGKYFADHIASELFHIDE